MDRQAREIVGLYIGDRSRESAIKLWHSLPSVYRQCAMVYTDASTLLASTLLSTSSTSYWEAYSSVIPKKRHRAVGKELVLSGVEVSGQTNHIERFNNT